MKKRALTFLAVSGLVIFQALPANAADSDGDLVDDAVDVCPSVADPFQGDVDGNGVGDLCETGANVILGTEESETLTGTDGDDALYGFGGDDTLLGQGGRDFLTGGPGVDTLTGGASCDVFAFDPSGDADVITDFDPAVDRLLFPAQDDDPSDDPLPPASFGTEDDHLLVTFQNDAPSPSTLEFEGLPGGEEIVLLIGFCPPPPEEELPPEETPPEVIPPTEEPPFECSPIFPEEETPEFFGTEFPVDGVFVNGTPENETLNGTDCSDVIAGDGGLETPPITSIVDSGCADLTCSDDVIYGYGGNDILLGDTAFLGNSETGGNDTIYGGDGDDLILGDGVFIGECDCAPDEDAFGGNDELFGDDGHDIIYGDALAAFFGNTTGGNDHIEGGDGDDFIVGDANDLDDTSVGGDDTLIGGDGDDLLAGDAESIYSGASAGSDLLIGGAGNDDLYGDGAFVDGDAATDTFAYDLDDGDFGDDIIFDAGAREVFDMIQFTGGGITSIADLDARSTVTEDAFFDVLAIVFTDATKTTEMGSILIQGIGTGSVASWADIDGSPGVDVAIVP